MGTAMTQDSRVSEENKWIRELDLVPELPGNDIGPLTLGEGSTWKNGGSS